MTWTAEQLSPLLIRPSEASGMPGITPDSRLEPAFLSDGQHGLIADARGRVDEAKAFYAHAIARHPTNLQLHVQRVVLQAKNQDPSILGAICDLFLVLEDNGLSLRRRMLALARPLLSKIDYQTLHRRLTEVESDSSALHSLSPSAVLSHGTTGVTRLICKQTQNSKVQQDPLQSAREQLEYGQTELAQQTLEHALLANPGRLALHLALLEIYRHARNRQQVEHTLQALQGQQNPAQREWKRLLVQLDKEAQVT